MALILVPHSPHEQMDYLKTGISSHAHDTFLFLDYEKQNIPRVGVSCTTAVPYALYLHSQGINLLRPQTMFLLLFLPPFPRDSLPYQLDNSNFVFSVAQ